MLPDIITPEFIDHLRNTYLLNWQGIHGYAHWMRVYENGMRVAAQSGANQLVVALFAFTHDMARQTDGSDYTHGPRAAQRIQAELQGVYFTLPEIELNLLLQAVELHTNGLVDADVTVQTCWDADRLDLGRVYIRPHPSLLCTQAARDPATIEWAYRRSRGQTGS